MAGGGGLATSPQCARRYRLETVRLRSARGRGILDLRRAPDVGSHRRILCFPAALPGDDQPLHSNPGAGGVSAGITECGYELTQSSTEQSRKTAKASTHKGRPNSARILVRALRQFRGLECEGPVGRTGPSAGSLIFHSAADVVEPLSRTRDATLAKTRPAVAKTGIAVLQDTHHANVIIIQNAL